MTIHINRKELGNICSLLKTTLASDDNVSFVSYLPDLLASLSELILALDLQVEVLIRTEKELFGSCWEEHCCGTAKDRFFASQWGILDDLFLCISSLETYCKCENQESSVMLYLKWVEEEFPEIMGIRKVGIRSSTTKSSKRQLLEQTLRAQLCKNTQNQYLRAKTTFVSNREGESLVFEISEEIWTLHTFASQVNRQIEVLYRKTSGACTKSKLPLDEFRDWLISVAEFLEQFLTKKFRSEDIQKILGTYPNQ